MSDATECSICLDNTTTYISCGCKSSFCHPCARQALLSSTTDPHCPNCRKGWNRDFLYDTLGAAFINKTYREHRRKVLLDTQKILLPDTMEVISREENFEKRRKTIKTLYNIIKEFKSLKIKQSRNIIQIKRRLYKTSYPSDKFDEIKIELKKETNILKEIEEKMEEAQTNLKMLQDEMLEYHIQQTDTTPPAPKITCPCPYPNCRGFIMASNHKCGICKNKICRDCREPLEAEHKCDPDTIETVKLLKKDTKSCPKCATPINKLDGCDQMWCPQCKVAFSWKTGQIETGYVHNPHYFEYMRRTGQEIRRNPQDIPNNTINNREQCEVPSIRRVREICDTINYRDDIILPPDTQDAFANITRQYFHLLQTQDHYHRRVESMQKQEDLRIKYLKNEITEKQMAETLVRRDKMREKCTVIKDVLEIVSSVATEAICGIKLSKLTEILRQARQLSIMQRLQTNDMELERNPPIHVTKEQQDVQRVMNKEYFKNFISTYREQMDRVCDYANEQFIKIAKNYEMKCPFIVSDTYVADSKYLYSYKELVLLHSQNQKYRLKQIHINYILKDIFEESEPAPKRRI
jgi:hypothetical protein